MANPFFSPQYERPERNKDGDLAVPRFNQVRTITASAQRIDLTKKDELESLRINREKSSWQTQAWAYSELIGEIRFAATLVGNLTSRIRLFPGYVTDEDLAPSDIQDVDDMGISDELKADARRALRLLTSGNGGMSGLLKDAAVNLFITGECYLFQRKRVTSTIGSFGQEVWEIRSVDELVFKDSGRDRGVYVKGRRGASEDTWVKQDGKFLGRIWHSYPRYSDEADSSLRPLLELMDELLMWNKAVRSAIKSQMNGGLLFLPDDIANMGADDGDGDYSDETPDPEVNSIEEDLLYAITAPISDENAASSVVPVILRGPAEMGEKIRHIPFSKNVSGEMQERADKVLDRILSGIDIPKDVVAGLGSSKYSNAMVIEESMYKSHIEPLALLIVDSLTTVFLHPVLKAYGYTDEEIERVVVWYDPSAIAAKPSKADAANSGYEKKVISGQAWRREHGFSESDAPTQLEVGQRLAVERGLLDEATSAALFKTLIPMIFEQIRQNSIGSSPGGEAVQDLLGGEQVPSADNPESMELLDAYGDAEETQLPQSAPTGLIEP